MMRAWHKKNKRYKRMELPEIAKRYEFKLPAVFCASCFSFVMPLLLDLLPSVVFKEGSVPPSLNFDLCCIFSDLDWSLWLTYLCSWASCQTQRRGFQQFHRTSLKKALPCATFWRTVSTSENPPRRQAHDWRVRKWLCALCSSVCIVACQSVWFRKLFMNSRKVFLKNVWIHIIIGDGLQWHA